MEKESNYLFIVNPKAGKGKSSHALSEIKAYLNKIEKNTKIILTEYKKHATHIVHELSSQFDHIIAVGGDGTLNEVINGLDITSHVNLGLLPVGSGNDFSLSLKQPKKLSDNLDVIFNNNFSLNNNKLRLGVVKFREKDTDEYKEHKFANAMGLGFDALVAHYNEGNKTLSGILSYITAIFKAIRYYYPLESEAIIGEKVISGKKLLFSVAKGKTSGGGFYLTPTAELFDDEFGICIIDFVKRFKLLRSLPLAIVNKLDTLEEALLTNMNSIEIHLKDPSHIHTDGEVISHSATNVKIELLKGNVKVISKMRDV